MSHLRPVRLLGALFALTLTLTVSAASPVPAGANGTGKPSTPTAAQGDAGAHALPAGARACRSTQAKPSDPSATCSTAAAAATSTASVSLPSGAAACASTATKQSSGTAACSGTLAPDAMASLAAFTVVLTASPVSLAPGGTTTLTATTNQDVGPTPYFIEIFDATTGAFEAECGFGTTCATLVAQSGSTIQNYIAYVSGFGTTFPPPSIQATSNTILVSWLTVTLTASPTVLRPGQTSLIKATASLDVGPTPFWIEIFDISSSAAPIICGAGTTCAASVTRQSAVGTYLADIAGFGTTFPPPNIRALSASVTVSWITVSLTASPITLPAGATSTVTATASLDVGPTPFYIEVFDQTLRRLVVICGSGASCSGSVSQPSPVLHSYVAFVAGFGTELPPPDVRAVSDSVTVQWISPPPPVTVPNLFGDSPEQAGDELQAAGLVLGGLTSTVDCNNLGTVDNQSPSAGTLVAPGSAVSITVGREPDPPMVCQ